MNVVTHIGGSRLVVFFPAKHGDKYIDVRQDKRPGRTEIAEVVENGFVIRREPLAYGKEPEAIVRLMRAMAQPKPTL